jgi:hypothetical protein
MTTTVVNVRKRNGKTPEYDVSISRPSKWGNPFRLGRGVSRETVVAEYAAWIVQQPELMAALPRLKDKRLGCWCAPLPCHGDVLAALADEEGRER